MALASHQKMDPTTNISPNDLLELLKAKHSDDLMVPECKDGPTHGGSHLRMDLWVMPRSWSKPWVSAYEIKVSRSDWMRDDKWPGYLQLCNMFSFVCPWGLIQPDELPESCGLFWASKNLTRLYCKRKPPVREVEIPETVWRYILMCRAQIKDEWQHQLHETMGSRIRAYIEKERTDYEIDRLFKQAVAAKVEKTLERNKELEQENRKLLRRIEAAGAVEKALHEVGADIHVSEFHSNVADQLRDHFGIGRWNMDKLKSAHEMLGSLLNGAGSK